MKEQGGQEQWVRAGGVKEQRGQRQKVNNSELQE